MANAQNSQEESQLSYVEQIRSKADSIAKYGGYDLLESAIENVQNLNPDRKARRKIFLTENNKKQERQDLLKVLELWSESLKSSDVI